MPGKKKKNGGPATAAARSQAALSRQRSGIAQRPPAQIEQPPVAAKAFQLVLTSYDPETFGFNLHFFIPGDEGPMRIVEYARSAARAASGDRVAQQTFTVRLDGETSSVWLFAAQAHAAHAEAFSQRLQSTRRHLEERWFPGVSEGIGVWACVDDGILLCWTVHETVNEKILECFRSVNG